MRCIGGQKVAFAKYALTLKDTVEVKDGAMFTEPHRWILQLRPLSSITDDEAIECCDCVYEISKSKVILRGETFIEVGNILGITIGFSGTVSANFDAFTLPCYQYILQSGFALPIFYHGHTYSVEQLTDWGFIKLQA